MFEEKVEEIAKEDDEKTKAAKTRAGKLHEAIGSMIHKAQDELRHYEHFTPAFPRFGRSCPN